MSFGYARRPSPAQQRRNKARRLVNLSVHEVSSVTQGAGMGCEVKLLKRDEGKNEMEKKRTVVDDLPAHKVAARDLRTADHVLRAFNLAKLNREHSEGKVDNVLYSQLLRHMAEAQYPGDKNAFAKFMKDNTLEMAEKVRADNERQQKVGALGNGYGAPLGVGSNYHGATGSGVGMTDRTGYNNTYSASAADTGVANSASPFTNAGSAVDASKRHANAITKDNIDVLMKKFGLNFDQAATMLARGGK
jgi:hypothetical protein